MKNLTRQFRRAMADDERVFLAYADITLSNGTVLNLTNEEIWGGGFSYEEAVSEDDNFTAIGSVVIGSAEVVINNIYEEYSPYDFTNASVVLYIGMQFEDRLEKIKIGTYQVDDAVYNGATVRLSLLDNIEQFDRPYSESTLVYPATLFQIVQEACTKCGVTLANNSQTFPHYQYTISTKPNGESLTFREVLSWCATLAGCFVKCNPNGELVFGWFDTTLLDESASELDGGTFEPWSAGDLYDGGTFNPWSTGDEYDGGDLHTDRNVHYITGLWSQNIAMDDVVITGVTAYVKDDSENATQDILQYSTGTNGYKIEISDNEFITKTNAQEIVNWLGQQLIGLRFRKLDVSQLSDPSIDAGDVGIVIDRKQNVYRILITRVAFSVSGDQTIVCGATTPSRNNATKYTSMTKSYVESRKQMKQERSAREQAVQQLEQAIEESGGLYTTIVTQQTGGNIYYLHNTPDLIDAKTVWKMTSSAWAVTDDWQGTDAATTAAHKWNAGLTVDGTFIAQIMSTIGLNFEWGTGGTLTLGGQNNTNGWLKILNASGTEIGRWNNQGVQLNAGSINLANNFIVTAGGAVTAKNIDAQGGYIGGITINNSYLRHGNNVNASNWLSMCTPNSKDGDAYVGKGGLATSMMHNMSYSESYHQVLHQRLYGGKHEFRVGAYLCGGFGSNYGSSDNSGHTWAQEFWAFDNNYDRLMQFQDSYVAVFGRLRVEGTFDVTGTKSRAVDTKDYSERLLYAYETASPMFGDVGEGIIGEDGLCYVNIDPTFIETISTASYQIFLQAYGDGKCYVLERNSTYFVVSGEPNLSFGWEIKAKQADYDQNRLEHEFSINPKNSVNYADLANEHLKTLREEREAY